MNATYGTLSVPGVKLCYKVRGEGPVLLILQGGAGDADTPDAMASSLASDFTVVTCDRRGLSRSSLEDPRALVTLEQHTADAVALLGHVTPDPAFVFGSSFGALVGLDLVARHPGCVRRLVAHDAPALDLLPLEEQEDFRRLRKRVGEIALSQGTRPAMRYFLGAMGVDNEDREDDSEPPSSGRERAKNSGFFLTRESRSADQYRLDLPALRAAADKVTPAFGLSSVHCFPSRCALALAVQLSVPALGFPGGHTGYVLRPRAFAETLRDAYASAHRPSYIAGLRGAEKCASEPGAR